MKLGGKHDVTGLELFLVALMVCMCGLITVFLLRDEQSPQAPPPVDAANGDDLVDLEYEVDEKGVSLMPGSGRSAAGRGKVTARPLTGTNGQAVVSAGVTNGSAALPAPKQDAGKASKTATAGAQSAAKPATTNSSGGKVASPTKPAAVPTRKPVITKPDVIRIMPDLEAVLWELEQQEWSRETEVKLLGVVNTWAALDPQAALEYALLIERRGTRNAALTGALGLWVKQSPDAAYEWFKAAAAADPYLLEGHTRALFDNLATVNIEMALSMVWGLPSASMKRVALGTIAGKMISTGNQSGVLALYDSVGDRADKSIVVDVLLQSMGRYEPYKLGAWVTSLEDSKARSRGLDTLVSIWAGDHPGAAAEWVSTQLPLDADRARQINTVTSAWVKENPAKTAAWLLSLFPPSGQTDAAVGTFTRAVMGQNPAYAATWSFTVTNPSQRWKLMEEIGRSWMKTAPAQAKAYIQKTDLPAKTKSTLLKL